MLGLGLLYVKNYYQFNQISSLDFLGDHRRRTDVQPGGAAANHLEFPQDHAYEVRDGIPTPPSRTSPEGQSRNYNIHSIRLVFKKNNENAIEEIM